MKQSARTRVLIIMVLAGLVLRAPAKEISLHLPKPTIPDQALAPKITRSQQIKGRSAACQINRWFTAKRGDKEDAAAVNMRLAELIDRVVKEAYQ